MTPKKKHSYLLLELLIALSILMLCLQPLIQTPFTCLQKQRKDLLQLHLHKKGEELLQFVEENLRTQKIPWKLLVKSQEGPIDLDVPKDLLKEDFLSNIKVVVSLKGRGTGKDKENNPLGTFHTRVAFFEKKTIIHKTASILFVCKKNNSLPINPLQTLGNNNS